MDGCRSVIAWRLLPHNTNHHQSHSQASCLPQISLLFLFFFLAPLDFLLHLHSRSLSTFCSIRFCCTKHMNVFCFFPSFAKKTKTSFSLLISINAIKSFGYSFLSCLQALNMSLDLYIPHEYNTMTKTKTLIDY